MDWNEYPFFVIHNENWEGPELAIFTHDELIREQEAFEVWQERENIGLLDSSIDCNRMDNSIEPLFSYKCAQPEHCASYYHNQEGCECIRDAFATPSDYNNYKDNIQDMLLRELGEIDEIYKDTQP